MISFNPRSHSKIERSSLSIMGFYSVKFIPDDKSVEGEAGTIPRGAAEQAGIHSQFRACSTDHEGYNQY